MIFKIYYCFETGCAAYLEFAAAKGIRTTHILDTHVHADHRSGGQALAKKGRATYWLHESANVTLTFEPLRDGQEIELGNTRVKVLHTPASASFVVTDLRRGADPWFVLSDVPPKPAAMEQILRINQGREEVQV